MGYRDFLSRNRKFESISLQRRVLCEPDFLAFDRGFYHNKGLHRTVLLIRVVAENIPRHQIA
jgi:hypothetical protein